MNESKIGISDSLKRDLSLVLSCVDPVESLTPTVTIDGVAVSTREAIDAMANRLSGARRASIEAGPMLTIEAARRLMLLARAARSRLVGPLDPLRGVEIIQTATLGQVMACDAVIQPGPGAWASQHPVAQAISRDVPRCAFIRPGVEPLKRLHAQVANRGAAALRDVIQQPVRRVAVVLPPDTEPAVVRGWHELAVLLQHELRCCVVWLPDMAMFGNTRGVRETLIWQSGSPDAMDFGAGAIEPDVVLRVGVVEASEGADTRTCASLQSGASVADVAGDPIASRRPEAKRRCGYRTILDMRSPGNAPTRIRITTPGLAPGIAARVMRFDGIILWLCDDPETSPPDPTVMVLDQLLRGLGR